MRKFSNYNFILLTICILLVNKLSGQNPIITDQFTADPSARVFDGKVYIYSSHDILANEERGRIGWFCMEDYHVFSSENLTDWKDHGVIVSQYNVPWADSNAYSMWAPDCISRNGKYYFYFPARVDGAEFKRGWGIGVAVSENPYGPFTPQPKQIEGIVGIDPNIFTDSDGQAYLYYSLGKIFVAKLQENMIELASEPVVIEGLPDEGLIEGPYLFERNGIYYLTYPHVENKTERLEYAIADNPLGPFTVNGVIMDELPGCWTNHQSILEYKDQWYLFYHYNDLSPHFDKNRSVRIDSLFFNNDGTIKKVIPTLRGAGITDASEKIQIDRCSSKSNDGVTITFLDTLNTFGGWKTVFEKADSWIQYNNVDFGENNFDTIIVKASSLEGSSLQLRLDRFDNPVIAEIEIPAGREWNTIRTPLSSITNDIHNVIVSLKDNEQVEADWISFE